MTATTSCGWPPPSEHSASVDVTQISMWQLSPSSPHGLVMNAPDTSIQQPALHSHLSLPSHSSQTCTQDFSQILLTSRQSAATWMLPLSTDSDSFLSPPSLSLTPALVIPGSILG